MSTSPETQDFRERMQHLDGLLQQVERLGDPAAQALTRSIAQAVLDLHGAGLERILRHLDDAGAAGAALLDACARDEVVSGLLVLHGLHPLDETSRVLQALDDVRPYLQSHGGNVELLGITDGVARLRLQGSCHGCPSSAVTMRQTIEEAILARAPDVLAVEVEGVADPTARTPDGQVLVSLPVLPAVH